MSIALRRDDGEILAGIPPQEINPVTIAARTLGKLGGRPKGSLSSPLSAWLRDEATTMRRDGYTCRESFEILRDAEQFESKDSFRVTDWTADEHDIDVDTRVTWGYFRKIWLRAQD